MFLTSPYMFRSVTSIYNVLINQNLLSGLKLCLDAGDIHSMPSSGSTQWKDFSGNGYDFNLGSSAGADTNDPTVHGTAGDLTSNEYLTFDGADWLTLAQANPTWVNNLHKDNAKYSLAAWFYTPTIVTGVSEVVFGTSDQSSANVGIAFAVGGTVDGDLTIGQGNGSGATFGKISTASARLTSATWNFLGFSLDEAAGTCILQINGTAETPTFTYTAASAAAATFTARIGDGGNGTRPFRSGARLASLAAWEGTTVSGASLTAYYNQTRNRFGV